MRLALKVVSIAGLSLAWGAAGSQAQDGLPSAPPAGGVYALDPTHASLTWKVSHMGMSKYVARFTKFDARLLLDPRNPAASSVTATIDPRSIQTDYPVGKRDFNKELVEQPTWFNTSKFPKIEFASRSVKVVGKNRAQVLGDLTLLGVKKPVSLDVVLNRAINPHP
jgi:polyisoprenoid-binding protein YceI